jgi:hypothetical protein
MGNIANSDPPDRKPVRPRRLSIARSHDPPSTRFRILDPLRERP